MAAMICPHCNSYSTFTTRWTSGSWAKDYMGTGYDAAIQCHNPECTRTLGAVVSTSEKDNVFDYWPKQVGGKDFPDVPGHIGSTADEAHQCMSIGAHRGAVALARAVVEATAKDHKIEKGMLDKKIAQMASDGIISSAMKDAADEIRFAGNEVAHGDLAEQPITSDDARDVLELMDAILTRVYQEPKQVERVRARRKERHRREDETTS
jgi:hypothetical protein